MWSRELIQHGRNNMEFLLKKGILKWPVLNNGNSRHKKPNPGKYRAAGWWQRICAFHLGISLVCGLRKKYIYILDRNACFVLFFVCGCHGYLCATVLPLLSTPSGNQCQLALTCRVCGQAHAQGSTMSARKGALGPQRLTKNGATR